MSLDSIIRIIFYIHINKNKKSYPGGGGSMQPLTQAPERQRQADFCAFEARLGSQGYTEGPYLGRQGKKRKSKKINK